MKIASFHESVIDKSDQTANDPSKNNCPRVSDGIDTQDMKTVSFVALSDDEDELNWPFKVLTDRSPSAGSSLPQDDDDDLSCEGMATDKAIVPHVSSILGKSKNLGLPTPTRATMEPDSSDGCSDDEESIVPATPVPDEPVHEAKIDKMDIINATTEDDIDLDALNLFAGRDFRLTDVKGDVAHGLIA